LLVELKLNPPVTRILIELQLIAFKVPPSLIKKYSTLETKTYSSWEAAASLGTIYTLAKTARRS
jgi:hypothetical protein